ncbi:FAD-dependent oxidoreductase [Trichothermofontia sichuanensis B231]|uniref:flavin monoamine oxidase family protein n=1 Tax=Trichothermofontia sichuanensis TaxID=3045816 RepID=UPI0022453F26|nr:FAD-dependent oxidoreductase [Trichothermofontia sichuanensis]UZQ52855.1 FAD-dependent oxidoreductase [Trichothermofontia sichuanensis B231]
MHRRKLLKLMALALVGCTSGGYAQKKGQIPSSRILVIGAGLAGLAAAWELHRQGYEVQVIEARDRVGGRIWTSTAWPDIPLDLGASWIHGVHGNPLSELADEIGAERVITRYESAITYNTNGQPLTAAQADRLDRLRTRLYQTLGRAQEQDEDISIRQAIAPLAQPFEPSSLEYRLINFILSSELEHQYAGSAASLSAHWYDSDEEFDGDDALFPEGFRTVTDFLARELRIELGQPVSEIRWGRSPVEVITPQSTLIADHVVVTLPLGVLKAQRVQFSPALPSEKRAAIAQLGMGVLNKCYLRFASAFWPDDVDWLEYIPATHGVWTGWVSFQPALGLPILLGLNAAEQGRAMEQWSDRQIVASAMDTLKTIFGAGIPQPVDYQITRWATDPFALGAYSYYAVGSTPRMRQALAVPLEKRLFFAGEATHPDFFGTAHGAYLSGLRAAAAILAI